MTDLSDAHTEQVPLKGRAVIITSGGPPASAVKRDRDGLQTA
jgi:hypothetical protein